MVAFAGSQWATKYTIPTAGVPADASNFAVLLTEANLPAALLDSTSGTAALSGGGDLLAYLQDPTDGAEPATRYPLEVVDLTLAAGPGGTAEVWVGLPSVSSSVATTFWLVWGDPAGAQPARDAAYGSEAVWPASHVMVQHLSEDPTGGAPQGIDSTSNGYDLTAGGGAQAPASASGQIGGAWQFDGGDQGSSPSAAALCPSLITVAAWCKVDSPTSNDGLVSHRQGAGGTYDESWILYSRVAGGGLYTFLINTDGTAGGRAFAQIARGTPGTWEYVVGTYDGSAVRIYKNAGTPQQAIKAGTIHSRTEPVYLGAFREGPTSPLTGCLDEVRILDEALTSDRITTEYNNQSSPGTFATNNGVQAIGAAALAPFPFYYWHQ
jgi:hypothetical protein